MREIKFRIWDERTKKMSPEFIFFGQVPADLNIMQYTGLKDRNGKEIYEGDIIIHVNFPNDFKEVYYHKGGFHAGNVLMSLYHSSVVQVCGNKFENPDYLSHEPTNHLPIS